VPYGTRSPQEILEFVTPIFEEMVEAGCQVIVIACNTVATTLIDELRQRFTIPLLGVEPLVAAAVEETRSGVIAVCATPTTLGSARYLELKQVHAANLKVLEPDCSDWSFMIEHKRIDQQKIDDRISEVLAAGADVIVLGCTHYHWIEEEITALAAGRAVVLQPEQALIAELKQVLSRLS
jgi:glutamate racemase